jgi:outer membrane protein assembly factor BamB
MLGKGAITSHDLTSGSELWRFTNVDSSFSSSATATETMLICGNGGPGSRSPLIGIRAGADGDISLKDGEKSNASVAYVIPGSAPGMASPVVANDLVYVTGSGTLACYEAATGKQLYKENLRGARMIAASPILVDDKLLITEETGKTLVVKTGQEYELLNTNELKDLVWSSASVAGNRLLIRGVDKLYCISAAK